MILRKALARAGALAMLFLIMSMAWMTVIQPAVELSLGQDDSLRAAQSKLLLLRQDAAIAPILASQLQRTTSAMRTSQAYWHGLTAPDISAAIQTRVRQIAANAGGMVISTADLSARSDHGFLRVQVRAELSQPISALYETLQKLESSEPKLVFDSLDLKPVPSGTSADEPEIAIEFVLSAYEPGGT